MTWHEKNAHFNSLIKKLFHEKDWQNRAEAAREIGLLKDGRATNLLCRALKKENDHTVVNKIIEALGRIGDAKATMPIIEKLKEELNKFEGDKFRLIYIVESLTKIKDKRALGYIGSFLNSPDKELKKKTMKAFDTIEPNWRNILDKEKSQKSINDIFKKKH